MESISASYARYIRRIVWSNRYLLVMGFLVYMVGFIFGRSLIHLAPGVYESIFDTVEKKAILIMDHIEEATLIGGSFILFWNNIKICLISMLLSVFSLLIFFFNGIILGVVSTSFEIQGYSLIKGLFLGILPHGIFELPGFFLAGSLGVRATVNIIKLVTGRASPKSAGRRSVGREFASAVRGFIMIVIPLILIASFIELTLTQLLVNALLRK